MILLTYRYHKVFRFFSSYWWTVCIHFCSVSNAVTFLAPTCACLWNKKICYVMLCLSPWDVTQDCISNVIFEVECCWEFEPIQMPHISFTHGYFEPSLVRFGENMFDILIIHYTVLCKLGAWDPSIQYIDKIYSIAHLFDYPCITYWALSEHW